MGIDPYTEARMTDNRATSVLAIPILVAALLLALCVPALGIAASGGSKANAETARPHQSQTKKVRPKPLYWGAWIGDQITGVNPPFDMGGVTALETLFGKGMSLIEFSSPFSDCHSNPCRSFKFPNEPMQNIRNYGAIPFFSWGSESTPPDPANYQLADIANGQHDAYLHQFAEEARLWGHPFFLRFDWEMNGKWFPWSEGLNGNKPGEYIAAWRHVHDIFTAVGATNATWVWCPFADAYGAYSDMRSLYPGNAYVDWTCLDGYNWGTNPVKPRPWRTFDEIFQRSYMQLTTKVAKKKPVILAELASTSNGGPKAVWIKEMLAGLPRKYAKVRGFIWLDSFDRNINWPIETSSTAIKAFTEGIARKIYQPNRYSELDISPIQPQR
jgi:hypothetical protein